MACEVCEHCHDPVLKNEAFTMREGYSYHEKCHKCYVCSETNLQNAEVFKGVIFCRSCSQRIFQGCSTARRTKNTGRRTRDKSHKRRSPRTDRKPRHEGILELSTLAVSDSSSEPRDTSKTKITSPLKEHTVITQTKKDGNINTTNNMKKSSVEMGMTTEVTQELLKQMNCPVAEYKNPTDKTKQKKEKCSDLRIAELGASTEIANMALRNKSELPVIIRSESGIRKLESRSMSECNRKSDDSGLKGDWIDSAYSSLRESTKTHWMDRRLGSILKLPYKAFKKNILTRSSLISVSKSTKNDYTLMKSIKLLFHEEITEHQKRGVQRLYSTINRNKVRNKLGWLETTADLCAECHTKRLKHCQNKRLAGFRSKVKNIVSPGFFLNMNSFNKNYASIKTSQACGNSQPGSTKV